jgi:hypothetical protein
MKRLSLIVLLVYGFGASAAKIIGNGGDVLVCDSRMPRVQLLDFAETRILRQKAIQLVEPPGDTYDEKLLALQGRINHRFSSLGRALAKEIEYFERTNVKLDDLELEDIQDSFHKFHLSGCEVRQIANQSIPLVDDDPSFILDNRLWLQLSEFDKAGLVLHEVLYRMGLRYALEHSAGVRYLVSLFFDDDLDGITDKQWIQAFMLSRMKYYEVEDARFPLFIGLKDTCEVTPGNLDCDQRVEARPAVTHFLNDGTLRSISYEGVLEPFEFRLRTGSNVTVNTDRLDFLWAEDGFRVKTSGRMKLIARYDRHGQTSLLADVVGEFNLDEAKFCGQIIFLRDDESILRAEKYCGKIEEIPRLRAQIGTSMFAHGGGTSGSHTAQ